MKLLLRPSVYPAADAPKSTSAKLARSLRSRIGEHLRSVRNNTPGFPVAQHFNSAGHSITDVQVRGMRLCRGSNILSKQLENEANISAGDRAAGWL